MSGHHGPPPRSASRRLHPTNSAQDGTSSWSVAPLKHAVLCSFQRSLAPVTLVSSAPEVQWVALRNINLILEQRPDILQNEMRVFFCKYNDPPYVKVEKLDIMVKLVTMKTVDTLLSELKECV